MATVRTRPPRVKPEPQLRACVRHFGGRPVPHVLALDGPRTRSDFYYLERLACAEPAYWLRKVDPRCDGTDPEETQYDVNLARGTCEFRGFLRWGRPCKHLRALRRVQEEGRLPA